MTISSGHHILQGDSATVTTAFKLAGAILEDQVQPRCIAWVNLVLILRQLNCTRARTTTKNGQVTIKGFGMVSSRNFLSFLLVITLYKYLVCAQNNTFATLLAFILGKIYMVQEA